MRTIKFRAKCLDNGEWVYGGSSLIADDFCVIQKGTEFYCETRVYSRTERFFQLQGFVCDKNTLGQFTGVLDYSKKEIWEDYIVNVSCLNYTGLAVIKFIDGAFCMVGENWIESLNGFDTDSLDIIGNIHDNPELLKR